MVKCFMSVVHRAFGLGFIRIWIYLWGNGLETHRRASGSSGGSREALESESTGGAHASERGALVDEPEGEDAEGEPDGEDDASAFLDGS